MPTDEIIDNENSQSALKTTVMSDVKETEEKSAPSKQNHDSDHERHFTESLYYDDDDEIQYAAFDGNDDVKVINPLELMPESAEASTETAVPTEKQKPKVQKKAKKSFSKFLNDLLLSIPSLVEHTGEITVNVFKRFFKACGAILAFLFIPLSSGAKKVFMSLKSQIKLFPSSLAEDVKGMQYELKIIKKQSRKMADKSRFIYFKAVHKYFVISFSRHSIFWKSVLNVVFPLVIIIALTLTFSSAQKKTFALEVTYNGTNIGYVENESVFEEAKAKALTLIPESTQNTAYATALNSEPVYKLSRVSLSELESEDMICENIITASDASLVRACGIYIDGEFICAVKNESDASSVFSSLLAPSKKKAADGTIVAFVEEISYVQGLYPEDTIWDSLTLKNTLNKPKTTAQYHTLSKKETAKSVAKKYSLTLSQLKALNSSVDFSNLEKGTKLLVAAETNYVRVKVMKTRTRTESIAYETVNKESSSLSKGTTKVYQNGRAGKYEITELVTYIDGKETYSTVVSKKQTVAPQNKIILVGTKVISYSYGGSYYSGGSYSGSYNSSTSMIWPTRGAYSISSRYGYRSASISGWSFHGGVDIVRSGGGSTGPPVVAAASGTVVTAISGYTGYGHTVVIDHGNGLRTRYAHMQAGSITVRVGQTVYQGQQIGRIGGTGNVTGPHLHFEVLKNGSKVNPLYYIG